MRACLVFSAAVLSLAFASRSGAAEKTRSAQANQTQPKKVWTNDDLGDLRARGLISTFVPEVPQALQPAPAPIATAPEETAGSVYTSRLEDPGWYAQQAADLQAELDRRQALLRQQQEAMDLAQRGITQPGVALDQPSFGITPQDAVANLEAQVREVQTQLDDLSDLARMNDIPPGVLRG